MEYGDGQSEIGVSASQCGDLNYEDMSESATKEYLSQNEWPLGLQDTIIKSIDNIPIRYFILDNSGSMIINDSYRIGIHNQKKA
jgi:hypothetical protein